MGERVMTAASEKLTAKIRKQLAARSDVLLLELPDELDQPDIVGLITLRFSINRTWDESVFQPFTKTTDEDHLIAFCIENRLDADGNLTRKAQKWCEAWVARGGLHIVMRSEAGVWRGLGVKP